MGCANSSGDKQPAVDAQRRRLSIGAVDKDGQQTNQDDGKMTEDDRGLIAALNEANIIEMLNSADTDRKFSIGSQTDQAKASFANKSMQQLGDDVNTTNEGLGFTCRKGLKPESPNQDSWSILKLSDFSLYGVFDGHGQKGHDVSNFVKENMPKLVIRDQRFKTDDMMPMLADIYKRTQSMITTCDRMKKLNAQLSGTTCTFVIHDHSKNKLTVSHVADSTCVMGTFENESKSKLKGEPLTKDHKPNDPKEKKRIEANGGRVVFDGYANHRIYAQKGRYPGLNMSRCLGDLLGHQDAGCSAEPDVSERVISPLDHILLLCSDGVWEFITAQEAVEIVGQYPQAKAADAANQLAKEAWDRWIREEGGAVVDDITVVLVYLNTATNN
jgi:serine/threonine protein phosphatase PrpC